MFQKYLISPTVMYNENIFRILKNIIDLSKTH